METYALVDVEKGWVIHFESYHSAIVYRNEVGSGVVLRECLPVANALMNMARAGFNTRCYD